MNKKLFLKPGLILASCLALLNGSAFADDLNSVSEMATMSKGTSRISTKVIDRSAIYPTNTFDISTTTTYKADNTLSWDFSSHYGALENLTLKLSYDGFQFNQFKVNREVTLGMQSAIFSAPHVGGSFAASVPLHIGDGEVLRTVTMGMPTVFYDNKMAGAILYDLIEIQFRPQVAMKTDFNFWYGYQVYGDLWMMADSSFGTLALENEKGQAEFKAVGFWQELPLNLTAIYGINDYFDVSVSGGFDDVINAKETFKVGIGMTVRGGKLFG